MKIIELSSCEKFINWFELFTYEISFIKFSFLFIVIILTAEVSLHINTKPNSNASIRKVLQSQTYKKGCTINLKMLRNANINIKSL